MIRLEIGESNSKLTSKKTTRLSSPKNSEVIPKFIASKPSNDIVAARLIKNKRSIIQTSRQPVDKILMSSRKVAEKSPVAYFHLDLSAIERPQKKLKTQKSQRFMQESS